MRWDIPGKWYQSGMLKCWRYHGRDKRWRDVSICSERVDGDDTGCCVAALNVLWNKQLQDGMTDGWVSRAWR